MKNDLTKETISALSTSFRGAVSLGIYDRRQIVRVYEPSKICGAFLQALHWQVCLQNSSNPEHMEARQQEKKLARRIFVSYFIPYLSFISHMTLQKWLALCHAVKDQDVKARMTINIAFTEVQWDNAFKNLLIMRADGMSSEDSEIPITGGGLLKKRKAVWRSRELREFLKVVRSNMGLVIQVPYAEQVEPLLSMRPAPAGLSINLYDAEFVRKLSTAAREQLNVQ